MQTHRDAENYLLFQFRKPDGETYLNNLLLDYFDQIMTVQQIIMLPVEAEKKTKVERPKQDEKTKASILDRLKKLDTKHQKRSLPPSIGGQK